MAIAFDAGTNGGVNGSSFSFNHTIASATGLFLVVATFGSNTGADDVTAVSANGKAMTAGNPGQSDGGGSPRFMRQWTLANPDAGVNSISVTYTGSDVCAAVAASYTGASGIGGLAYTQDLNNSQSSVSSTITAATSWALISSRHTVAGITGQIGGTYFAQVRITDTSGLSIYDSDGPLGVATQVGKLGDGAFNTDWANAGSELQIFVAAGGYLLVKN